MFKLWSSRYGEYDLDDLDNGVVIERKDFGWPIVRNNSIDRPGMHGTYDNSAYFGSRVIQIDGSIVANRNAYGKSRSEILQEIRRYCMADARPVLIFDLDGETLYATLRVEQQSVPIESWSHYKFNFSWRADPFFRTAETSDSAPPLTTLSGGSDIFNESPFFDVDFSPDGNTYASQIAIDNTGYTDTYPMLRITGECISPQVEEVTTGNKLLFNGLTINAGSYIDISMEDHTAFDEAGVSVLGYIDYSVSSWFGIPPGESQLQLSASSADGSALLTATWSLLQI